MSATIHWLCTINSLKAFCGVFSSLNTTRREIVTCRNCLRLMRLHGHLPHVPAVPDADPTICWKCGLVITADPDTHLWRPLTPEERRVRLVENALSRWVVVHARQPGLAWTGARWAPYALPRDYQVSNFATRAEALAYAQERSFLVEEQS